MHAQVVQRGEVLATEVAAVAQLLLVALDVLQERVQLREGLRTALDHTFVHLLILVLGHVGLELEVGTELAGAELAQVGAIDEDHLLGLQLVPLPLAGCGQGLGLRGTGQGLAQPCGESQGGKSLRKTEEGSGQRATPPGKDAHDTSPCCAAFTRHQPWAQCGTWYRGPALTLSWGTGTQPLQGPNY